MQKCTHTWPALRAAAVLWMACAIGSTAWAQPLPLRTLVRKGDADDTWRYPVVDARTPAAEKINAGLFLQTIGDASELVPPADPMQALKGLGDEVRRSLPSMDYQVLVNDGHVLSIVISGEGCGAYCETYEKPVAFDVSSGRLLTPQDLLTPQGRAALIKRVEADDIRSIREEIRHLRAEQKKQASPDNDEAIAMYETCLKEKQGREPAYRWLGILSVLPDGLAFGRGRCSNHAMQGLDELGNFSTTFKAAELERWLTPYGKAIVSRQTPTAQPASSLGQWLHGTLGSGTAVTLYVRPPLFERDSVHGFYFYDRYRKPITLSGTWQGDMLALVESNADNQPQADLVLKAGAQGLSGTWKRRSDGKAMPLKFGW